MHERDACIFELCMSMHVFVCELGACCFELERDRAKYDY